MTTISIDLEASERLATCRLALNGQLDSTSASSLETAIDNALKLRIKTLVFDLRQLSFISSAGLRIFAKAQRIMHQRDGRLLFVNVQPQVQKVFDIIKAVRVSDIFASYQELDEYLEAMQQEQQ